ncbi:MAG: SoxR reducing system RseC family protein [Bacteroidales bacterium]|nr:SoxR reducing system RseC family protein [Bacteroidales bacterium]
MTKDRINHDGKVVEITDSKVIAEIMVSEACGTCQAKGLCHTQGKRVRIEAPRHSSAHIEVGDSVNVSMTQSLAMSSVFFAYVLPLIIMFGVMFSLIAITGSQDTGCLIGLATLPVYYIVLYALRNRLRRNFNFEISAK